MQNRLAFNRMKHLALLLLLCATGLFIVTLFLPASWPVLALKSMSEAAMIGGLADWFAVSALFRSIPIPLIGRHTAIIPRNKPRIADNLGQFIEQRFLNPEALTALLRRSDPVNWLARWLLVPANQTQFSGMLNTVLKGILSASSDQAINRLLHQAVNRGMDQLDLRRAAISLLTSLTRENRHQALLDTIIRQLVTLLAKPTSRQLITEQITAWFQHEYPTFSKLVSGDWMGEKGANKLAQIVDKLLLDIAEDPNHQLRHAFNRSVKHFLRQLQQDPQMLLRMEKFKGWIKADPDFARYIQQLATDLRQWLINDLSKADSTLARQLQAAAGWLGRKLHSDAQLRTSLNQYLEQGVLIAGPQTARFFTGYISTTIKQWDDQELVAQIEQHIGRDLQFIRINGTLVGAVIGLLLFVLSQLPALIHS